MRLWSTLAPWEWRAELAKVHPDLTEDGLIACGLLVPEIQPQIERQRSREDKARVALRYFGDEGHPQPAETARYGPASNGEPVIECPRWEQLPPLEVEAAAEDDLVGGLPYSRAHYDAAGKLYASGRMTVAGIKTRTGLSTKRAHRIYRQFKNKAVVYDDGGGSRPGSGYRWDPAGLRNEPHGYKLIRA